MAISKLKQVRKEQDRIKQLIKAEYLGLDNNIFDSDLLVNNILEPQSKEDVENPHIHLLRIIRNPNNFYFTCKYVLNKEIAPFQAVILRELWYRKYPMLIASRGASKSWLLSVYAMLRALINQGSKIIVVGSAFRQAKVVFEYCEAIWHDAPILRDIVGIGGRSGPRRDIDRCTCTIGDSQIIALPMGNGEKIRGQRANVILTDEFHCLDANSLVETNNGLIRIKDCDNGNIEFNNMHGAFEQPVIFVKTPLTDVYEIVTKNGYSFKCSSIHKVLTMNGWKLAKDLDSSDYLVFDNKYTFPAKEIVDVNTAWLLGVLLSEGSVKHDSQIQITNTDYSYLNKAISIINKLTNDKKFSLLYTPAYIDKRGWSCKEAWRFSVHSKELRSSFDLDYTNYYDKIIPNSILQSSRNIIISFLSGLFEGDGSCFLWNRKKNNIGVAYYTVSKQLVIDLQVLLKKLGYLSSIQTRKSKISNNIQYMLRLNGKCALLFAKELAISKWKYAIDNCYEKNVADDNARVIYDKSRNKYMVHVTRCGKNIFIGRYDTYDEALVIYNKNKPIEHIQVKKVVKLDYVDNLYDVYLPTTHSFYANCFVQHNTVPKSIYEEVVSGFAAVSKDPVDSMKHAAHIRVLKRLDRWTEEQNEREIINNVGNQAIIAGTANYTFNHFADYWREYKGIIESKGDKNKLLEALKGNIPSHFNWKNYSIIRLPVELLPEAFMDEEHVARHKITTDKGSYAIEYGAVFAGDSNGFYPRSIIEKAVVRSDTLINMLPDVEVFHAKLVGQRDKEYIFSVDTASESDNFAITLLELYHNHRRAVYCWTTTRAKHLERIKHGVVKEKNFYAYCARKIRDLMKVFICKRIMMDAQGGGRTIAEALHDMDKLEKGELPIWEVRNESTPGPDDDKAGLHILELVEFSNAKWVSEANHGMKKDLEDKVLLFPYFDPVLLEESNQEDKKLNRIIIDKSGKEIQLEDTLEDVVMEIEALKNELVTIQHTQTPGTNRDHWDTPHTNQTGGRKGRLRKDRYSALLMANMGARQLMRATPSIVYSSVGGIAKDIVEQSKNLDNRAMYEAPDWFFHSSEQESSAYDGYGTVVRRGYED